MFCIDGRGKGRGESSISSEEERDGNLTSCANIDKLKLPVKYSTQYVRCKCEKFYRTDNAYGT